MAFFLSTATVYRERISAAPNGKRLSAAEPM
jgi:hypothetical protein